MRADELGSARVWDLYTIHDLLQLQFPVGLAIDVYTYPPDRAHITLMNSYNALEAQLNTTGRMGRDTKSEAAWADCDYAMKAVDAGQRLHRVVVGLLIKGTTELHCTRTCGWRSGCSPASCAFGLRAGNQLEALKLFTPVRDEAHQSEADPAHGCFRRACRSATLWAAPAQRHSGYPVGHRRRRWLPGLL